MQNTPKFEQSTTQPVRLVPCRKHEGNDEGLQVQITRLVLRRWVDAASHHVCSIIILSSRCFVLLGYGGHGCHGET